MLGSLSRAVPALTHSGTGAAMAGLHHITHKSQFFAALSRFSTFGFAARIYSGQKLLMSVSTFA